MKKASSIVLAGAAFALAACGSNMAEEETAMETTPMNAEYTVFFGFDESTLSTLGEATVAQASEVGVESSAAVSVVGHTDTSGSVEYNQALSEQRAATVSNALISGGIAADAITASGRSEMDLAIDTEDGVREPRNRRVEITLAGMMMMEEPMAEDTNCVITSTGCEINGDGVVETN